MEGDGRRRRAARTALSTLLIALPLATGCGDAPPEAPTFTLTDSAGVQIAYSAAPAWGEGSPWSLSDEPTVVIGSAMGDEAYVLHLVQAVTRLPDDRIAVVNRGTFELRLYDARGRHLRSIGGPGDGPGDFRWINRVWAVRGDSLMAFDSSLRRVSVFDGRGDFARTVPIRPYAGAVEAFVMRPLTDGTLLVQNRHWWATIREGLFSAGARTFARYDPAGEPLDSIAEFVLGSQWGYRSRTGGVAYTGAPFSVVSSPPAASDGRSLHLGTHDFVVNRWDPEGGLLQSTRWAAEHRIVTPEVENAYHAHYRRIYAEAGIQGQERDRLEGLIFPDRMPPYQRLLVDAAGHLWVEQYRARWETARRWWVFDPEGRWLGEPPVPTALDVREVGHDYLLAVHTDEHDVERVVMFGLDRGG